MAEPIDARKAAPKTLAGRIGKYEIVRLLGRGAMGQVYVAHDTVLDRDVALKVMAAQIADDPELKQRFEREARAVARMTHPNVVTVFDLFSTADGSSYIAMELLKGQDLQRTLRQGPPLPLERKVLIIVQVLAGLAHAHHAGIVHRDIKPANIFIQEDGSVKIMDFGVARLTTASITGTGNIVGTADYMSPEQVQGAKVDGRSDLFSVGCMLFELLAGSRPFHAESLMAVFYKITHEEADLRLIPQGPGYDSLTPLVRKALARNVSERYQTARELAADLRDWLKTHAAEAGATSALALAGDLDAGTSAAPATAVQGPGGTRAPGETVLEPTPSRPHAAGRRRASAPKPAPAPRARVLPWAFAALALAALALGAALLWKTQRAPQPASDGRPQPTLALAPTATPPPVSPATTAATPAPPPVTAAPQPTFARADGRSAAAVRSARTAFESGNYDAAVPAAQQALREETGSEAARQVLGQALAGKRALLRVRAGETALARGDLVAAEGEAEAALAAAPWERSAVDLRARVDAAKQQTRREAEAKAQQARTAQVNALLVQAASAMEAKQFDAAIATYGRVLELDPGNVAAHTGKSNAVTAKTIAEAAASAPRAAAAPAHLFVAGRTEARGRESSSAGPVGFEQSPGVVVKNATQAAELPGKIQFEAIPPAPQPGQRFSVMAYLRNEGAQSIQLSAMVVAASVDGRTQKGRVPPVSSTVAPGDRALVFQARDQVLKEGTSAWTLELTLFAGSGETYRNTLSWK